MLGNLALVVAAHDDHLVGRDSEGPFRETIGKYEKRADLRWFSAFRGDADSNVTIDRVPELLAAHHGLYPRTLQSFAAGGVVADIGAGESSFLDIFEDVKETIAIDVNRDNCEYQREMGHTAYCNDAHRLTAIGSNTVRLLHASFSAPFWARSIQEAAQTAWEYLRVLEPGGIALVGPTARSDEHRHYEYVARARRHNRTVLPWGVVDDAHASHIWMSFCRTVLANQQQGDLQTGYVDIVGSRYIRDDEFKSKLSQVPSQLWVPNFLMLRAIKSVENNNQQSAERQLKNGLTL